MESQNAGTWWRWATTGALRGLFAPPDRNCSGGCFGVEAAPSHVIGQSCASALLTPPRTLGLRRPGVPAGGSAFLARRLFGMSL